MVNKYATVFFSFIITVLSCHTFAKEVLIDPTRPADYVASASGEQSDTFTGTNSIAAIFKKADKYYAVIDGTTLQEGQEWQGKTVINIHRNGVVLDAQGRQTELLLNQFTIKKETTDDR